MKSVDVFWLDEVNAIVPRNLDDDGIGDFQGRQVVALRYYAKKVKRVRVLLKDVANAGLQPVEGVQFRKTTQPIDVYWKDEVDAVIPKFLDDEGVVEIDGRLAIGVSKYSDTRKPAISWITLEDWIKEAGLIPIKDKNVMSKKRPVECVYWKDEVDELLPLYVNELGIVDVKGRSAIAVYPYAASRKPCLNGATLTEYVAAAGLQPVPDVKVLRGSASVSVYWQDEIDAIIPSQLDKRGIVVIRGREAVALTAYGKQFKPQIRVAAFSAVVSKAALQPVPDARVINKTAPVTVYWKDEIDAVLLSQGKYIVNRNDVEYPV